MSEAEWLVWEQPARLISSRCPRIRKGAAADERFHRFAIACCRRLTDVLGPSERDALEMTRTVVQTVPRGRAAPPGE